MQLVLVSWETHVVVLCRLPQPEQNKKPYTSKALGDCLTTIFDIYSCGFDCSAGMLSSDALGLAKTGRDAMQVLQDHGMQVQPLTP
jgi:hypothetical protein